jgi:hypothetical protein
MMMKRSAFSRPEKQHRMKGNSMKRLAKSERRKQLGVSTLFGMTRSIPVTSQKLPRNRCVKASSAGWVGKPQCVCRRADERDSVAGVRRERF